MYDSKASKTNRQFMALYANEMQQILPKLWRIAQYDATSG